MEPGVHAAQDEVWGGAGGKKTGKSGAGTLPGCVKAWDMTQYTCSTA